MTTNHNTEVELKLVLDDEQAHGILRAWLDDHGHMREALQRNHYLDTTDRLLARRRIMLRVRITAARVMCTAKAGAAMVDGVMRVSEWEAPLEPAAAAAWRAGRSSCVLRDLPPCAALAAGPLAGVADVGGRTLHVIGVMQTTRRAYRLAATQLGLAAGPDLVLELDHSLFPAGGERFELEVEHRDASQLKSGITALLDDLGISWQAAKMSKYQQFLEAQASAPAMHEDADDA